MEKRNIAEFEQLFKRNYSRLCTLAYRMLEDAEEAKDIVNDVFESAWTQASLKWNRADAYLYTAVRNRCLNHLEHRTVRKQYSYVQEEIPADEAGYSAEKEQLLQQIEAACRELPDKTRYILSQCYFHQKKYKEVADELSITPDAVKKHIMKALKFLRESIRKE